MFLIYALIYGAIIFLGGWIVVALILYSKWSSAQKLDKTIGGWMGTQEYIVLQMFPPATNDRSMAEMEAFYINIASIFRNISKKDMYLDGKVLEAYSFEVHSRGGQIAFYVRMNRNYLPLLRSSLAAHYPGSDLIETPDPFASWPKTWEGSAGPYTKFAAADITLGKSDMYPLKPWTEFQRDDNNPITDPVSTLITALEAIEPKDYAVIQFILKPKSDPDKIKAWNKEISEVRAKFKSNANTEIGDDGGIKLLTKQEQNILNSAEAKISGENFHTKIRVGFFTATAGPGRMLGPIMGYFKQFASEAQFLKPEGSTKTAPGGESALWGKFQDKYYYKREGEVREKRMYQNLVGRSFSGGSAAVYVNVKSMAAMFHFPSTEKIDQSLASRVSTGEGAGGVLTGGTTAPRDLPT
jgi:hypothetical protein